MSPLRFLIRLVVQSVWDISQQCPCENPVWSGSFEQGSAMGARPAMMRGILLVCALALVSCETVETTQPGAVGVDRQQTMLLASSTVNREADKAYVQTLEEATKKGTLNRNPVQIARVHRIVNRLILVTGAFRADAPSWAWEVNVITSKNVNAWCMPGGKMAVYTGLIEHLKVTDEELAAVMGHEMAHALREHGRERVSQALTQSIGIMVLGLALDLNESAIDLVGTITDLTFNLPNSREHESEADRIGIELAARAGFDPRAAISLWQKMAQVDSGELPEFLSTHPSHEDRIRDLRTFSTRVMPLYETSRW